MLKLSGFFSLSSNGLRRKLVIAFSLMSVLPLMVCLYLVSTYILPRFGLKLDVILSVSIVIFTSILGFIVINEIFDRFLDITNEAKLIASGDTSRKLELSATDEMNILGQSLNQLTQRVDKLETKDALTDLYNKAYILNYLQEEIRRSIVYQRPCSFVILNVDNFTSFCEGFGSLPAELALKKIGSLVKESVSQIDKVARIGDNEFAIVLPETNKRKAKDIAEEIRGKIESTFSKEQDVKKRLTLSGGISENPLDGTKAEELINKAKEALFMAKAQGKNNIVV